jgi:hypothetical protein
MKNSLSNFLVLLLVLQIFNPCATIGQDRSTAPSIKVGRLTLSFNVQTRRFELNDINEGLILSAGIVKSGKDGEIISTDDHETSYVINECSNGCISICFDKSMIVNGVLSGDSLLSFSAEGESSEMFYFTARAPLSDRTIGAILENEKNSDNNTVVQTLGISDIPELKSIFDPKKDLALQLESGGNAKWEHFHQWQIKASAKSGDKLCGINIIKNYYRDILGITYYGPVKKRSYFQKAPALAITWVGIEGKFNRPEFSQRKEWLYPNIDWVSKNLLPYAGEMVFQLDDNYPIDDPDYMKDISDYIRSKGLIPGIWLAPFGVAPYEEEKKHPDWFIHKPDGTPITTFSGLSYDDVRHYCSGVLNVNNDEAVDRWFAGFLKEVSDVWNYDYFKIDGIPAILDVYKQSVDGGGVDGVRRGLQIIRSVVGQDKFINTCWGLPIEGVDIVNGSRVGGDTEQLNQVISSVAIAQNYLNNVAWYSDPDGAANMYASTASRARLNFQGRSILGQPYVTDDSWTKVPDNILSVWQKTLPTIESFPTNLYHIKDPHKYDHIDLKIKKPWGEWDIVSLNNYENRARTLTLDLERLPLTSEKVYLFDFWNQKYLGTFDRNSKITRNMEAIDAHCFSVVPVNNDQPVLLSTTRHFTQGGIDIDKMCIAEEGDEWVISGESMNLIKDDPYELVFKSNGFMIDNATAENGSVAILNKSGIARIRIIPDKPEVNWQLLFIPEENNYITFDAELVHVAEGEPVEIPVVSSNGNSYQWSVKSADGNVKVTEDHYRSLVKIELYPDVLELDESWTGRLTLESRKTFVKNGNLKIEALGPVRENIATKARASASSIYFYGDQNGYGRPDGANDMLTFKAWEAAEGETDGWLELIWEKPVTFQRIVIDEWMESGGEIQSWRLEAGHKKYEYTPKKQTEPIVTYEPETETMQEVARGRSIGRGYVIELDKPVTANVLNLIINNASKRPGIWEIEVNP